MCLIVSDKRSGALRVGLCCRGSLDQVEIEFGIGELLESLDLQTSVPVGNDIGDVNRLAHCVRPEWALRLTGVL